MKIATVEEMRAIDLNAIENLGIAAALLMENAGNATVALMRQHLGDCQGTFACIFIGPGANGGDGLVIGRRLAQMGCQPLFMMLADPEQLTGEAASNYVTIGKMGIPVWPMPAQRLADACDTLYRGNQSAGRRCYALIDAIFGVGLNRPPQGIFAEAIAWINRIRSDCGIPVVAVDCPSGLQLNTGRVTGPCVMADHTACFGFPQPGHVMAEGKELCGKLHVLDIGLTGKNGDEDNGAILLADDSLIKKIVAPLHRPANCHKGNHGHLLIVGGSPGKTGAALLAARGALRAGAGLISLAASHTLLPNYTAALPEAMTIPGTDTGEADLATILAACDGKSAMALGPGFGLGANQEELALRLYLEAPLPMVVDADAITLLAKHPDKLPEAEHPRIFTPHPGEMGRLLRCSASEVQRDRLAAVRRAQALLNQNRRQHVLLLKGAGTIIASPDEQLFINATGNAGMATGGMGDVLTGVIGSLIGQCLSLTKAAVVGAYLHGLAADMLLRQTGIGYLASEVADSLPAARRRLLPDYGYPVATD
ncbi:MAG: NAD(P)H-hydrate dehydratase [Desulfobulbaceae bacterium]|jgi:NAD(P)H-hydrate epimerase|nr:NAD(P)H-hydrate dehydratase [Desulfobulbaceae bacterium]